MKQQCLGLGQSTERTGRRDFLDDIEQVVPWGNLVALASPHLPEKGQSRTVFPVESMLRIYFLQLWFNLSDPAMEYALHDEPLFRKFAGLGGWDDWLADEAIILWIRHKLEEKKLAPQTLRTINDLLQHMGQMPNRGTGVDAMLIAAPTSTKNASGKRDPEKKQSTKGIRCRFGMNARIRVDAASGLVDKVSATADSVNEVVKANSLLHVEEVEEWDDAGNQGADTRPNASEDLRWNIAIRPSSRKKLDKTYGIEGWIDQLVPIKAQIRVKVEHPFRAIKHLSSRVKSRYRGLKNNVAQVHTLFALANLWMARRQLRGARHECAPRRRQVEFQAEIEWVRDAKGPEIRDLARRLPTYSSTGA